MFCAGLQGFASREFSSKIAARGERKGALLMCLAAEEVVEKEEEEEGSLEWPLKATLGVL